MNIVYQSRVLLIRFAKAFPFFLCFLVAISFSETLIALLTDSYANLYGNIVPYKPLSWFIARQYEYGILSVISALALSVAFETCVWNKLCIVYLAFVLWEKYYLIDIELYIEQIYMITFGNIVVSAFLIYKCIKMLKDE